ncbi:hypothetical protein OOZ15_18790 [Galbibacter sp. EGI 63066]|uniref:hypothetical protein n=1 Tax=Galbibacter sp. EGI 63066 TaxID=2993559 RepID=UPI002248C69A|nr:hypothetical protein [Galbibacter sp. EGI 63066]MCX2682006.1 hypothetical protein [Galbibacter sp. EGI 63066]
MKQKLLCILLFFVVGLSSMAQSVDLEQFGKEKPLKVTGNIAANSVYYNSNQNNAREPFTYFLQGTLHVQLYSFAMPISYSFTNQGEKLDYQVPFNFNRLSLHPKYKWITGHIGDVNMTFSPYTLSGHQFTGAGVDLTPEGNFKISAMAGRMLKATEDDEDPRTVPAFKRMGYGLKTEYETRKYSVGIIGFYAKDAINSLDSVPEQKKVLPKENMVLSLEGSYKITNNLDVFAEYASSAITQDLRADDRNGGKGGLSGLLFNSKTSTEYYTALKAGVNYKFDQSSVGVAYERIDPGYETLGAYYFNNDFENITLNAATTAFNNKVSLAFNVGYQRDDIKNQKDNATSRMVGSVNASANLSERLSINGSYSNFRTYTNVKVNQFENINDDNLLDNNLDTLDYRQLSQNANLGINYVLSQKENLQQNIAFNYNVSDVANEQNGIVRIGDASIFHNINTAYTLTFPKQQLNVTTAVNATLNTIGREDASTLGPTLSVNKRFFDSKLNAGLSSSYNITSNTTGKTSIANIRANAAYLLLKRHHINLSLIQLFRNNDYQKQTGGLSEFTATLGYNYSFDLPPKFKKKKKDKIFNFTYREYYFEGEHDSISPQVVAVSQEEKFRAILKIKGIKSNLKFLEEVIYRTENDRDKKYKQTAIDYLKYLYDHKDFLDTYNDLAFKGLKKLYREAVEMNYVVEKEYFALQAKVNSAETENEKDIAELKVKEKRYVAHTHMMEQLHTIHFDDILNDNPPFKTFKDKHISKVFTMLENGKSREEIQTYIEIQFADMYHKEALQNL